MSERYVNANGAVLTRVVFNLKETMTDDEYAEHIRAGMWRRTHAEESRHRDEAERAKRERQAAERAAREKARQDEVERIKRLEERSARRKVVNARVAREAYGVAWRKLLDAAKGPLKASDFVWPMRPMPPPWKARPLQHFYSPICPPTTCASTAKHCGQRFWLTIRIDLSA